MVALLHDWPTFGDVLAAYKACQGGKPASNHQIAFERQLLKNLIGLHRDIHERRYKPSASIYFIVTEPKPREVFAAHFRDRIVHHLIVSQLEKRWEPRFSDANFACRKAKGTHGAMRYLQRQVRRISQGGRLRVWALQLDLAAFFVSIDREILCDLVLADIRHPTLQYIAEVTDRHDARKNCRFVGHAELRPLIAPGRSWLSRESREGLPIGSLTSQFAANVYLNGVDHFIQRQLKPLGYLRYMDDLTLLDTDVSRLRAMTARVDAWLCEHRRQELNPVKTHLTRLDRGIEYLGYRFAQCGTANEPLSVFATPKKKWRLVSELKEVEAEGLPRPLILDPLTATRSRLAISNALASVNSGLGQFRHARSFQFRRVVLEQTRSRLVDVKIDEHYHKIISL